MNGTDESASPAAKRIKVETNGESVPQELMAEVECFAAILSHTLGL
jgi:hypothetical protein